MDVEQNCMTAQDDPLFVWGADFWWSVQDLQQVPWFIWSRAQTDYPYCYTKDEWAERLRGKWIGIDNGEWGYWEIHTFWHWAWGDYGAPPQDDLGIVSQPPDHPYGYWYYPAEGDLSDRVHDGNPDHVIVGPGKKW